MIEILRIGENSVHGKEFEVNRPNGHPVYLLLFVKTPARFWAGGEWQDTPANVAVVFKPGQQHLYSAGSEHYQNDWIHFQANTAPLGEHFPFGQPIPLHAPDEFYQLFHLIYNEYYKASPHRSLIINNLTAALLDKISDESMTRTYPDIYYDLAGLREQIYKFPANAWSTDQMSAQLNISTGYLHSLYRQYFDTTCMNDVIQSRIQYACELLTSGSKPLSEIAELCGYHNVEHFIRQFKAVMRVTPGRYRHKS